MTLRNDRAVGDMNSIASRVACMEPVREDKVCIFCLAYQPTTYSQHAEHCAWVLARYWFSDDKVPHYLYDEIDREEAYEAFYREHGHYPDEEDDSEGLG